MQLIVIVGISLFLAFLNISIIHMIKIKFPKSYFSLGEMIITEKDDISTSGIITKFSPPLIIGLIIGLLSIKNGLEITILFSFFAAFLVVWPVILSGNELLSFELKKKIKTLYLLYIFYIVIYILSALFGNFIGNMIKGIDINLEPLLGNLYNVYNSWNTFTQGIVTSIIGAAIFSIVGFLLIKIYRFIIEGLKRKIQEALSKLDYK